MAIPRSLQVEITESFIVSASFSTPEFRYTPAFVSSSYDEGLTSISTRAIWAIYRSIKEIALVIVRRIGRQQNWAHCVGSLHGCSTALWHTDEIKLTLPLQCHQGLDLVLNGKPRIDSYGFKKVNFLRATQCCDASVYATPQVFGPIKRKKTINEWQKYNQ